ncbi:autotransporter domain-containing protein [Nitrosomonas eutropha]|nr:autotransporter domain-containing protein [Nitrosomonas eutropha]
MNLKFPLPGVSGMFAVFVYGRYSSLRSCLDGNGAEKHSGAMPAVYIVRNHTRLSSALVAASLFSVTALTSPVLAADLSWTGATSNDWFTTGNWLSGSVPSVPTESDSVGIYSVYPSVIGTAGAVADTVYLGADSNGANAALQITGSGTLSTRDAYLGILNNFSGTVTVDGPISEWQARELHVGRSGTGTLTVSGGGSVDAYIAYVGENDGSSGTLRIESGGKMTSTSGGYIGVHANADGKATVTGQGAQWIANDKLVIGMEGEGSLFISDYASASVTGRGSIGVGTEIGSYGSLVINSGSTLSGVSGFIGGSSGSMGRANVIGSDSQWTSSNSLAVGQNGHGTLTVSDDGLIQAPIIHVASLGGGTGTVNIGEQSGVTAAAPGILDTPNIAFGGGTGTLVFNHTSNNYLFAPVISGEGFIKAENGRTVLTGNSTGFTGSTAILSGATLQLGNGGTTGLIAGNMVNNGTLAFNRSDTVTLAGAISGSGAVQQIGAGTTILAGSNSYTGDTKILSGTLQFGNGAAGGSNTLGGRLDVTGGTLAIQTPATLSIAQGATFAGNNTALSIVATPGAPSLQANSVVLRNGVTFNLGGINSPSQLDKVLIDTAAGITGNFGVVTVGGFSGPVDYLALSTRKSADNLQYLATYDLSWMTGNNLAHGTFTLTNPDDSFVVGVALTDQIANVVTGWNGSSLAKAGSGTLILTGANTYTGGTTITSGTLQLGNGDTTGSITGNVVNDGVLAFNRSDTVTFASAISGSGAVQQIGAGTTILTGSNSYTGGTEFHGGTLQISSDANLGAPSGGLSFTGGTLATTASFDSIRSVSLTQPGRINVASGTELGLRGGVSGGGDLVKQGDGTLRLDHGANTYGNTRVEAGALIGNAGSISGNISNAGTVVFDQAGNAGFTGDIAALNGTTGTMVKRGIGSLTLAGTSSLGWVVQAGNLISSAERFGGNIMVDSGASFTFDQIAAATYAGVISGNGNLIKAGTGGLNLTGNSSAFTGTTSVGAGTLAVNGELGGTVDILSAGRLQGTGTVGNAVITGMVAPGNSIGTLHVAGDIGFNPGSIYEVEINAAGQSDRIDAAGMATLNGGWVQVLAGAGSYSPQMRHTILTARGGRTGTFDGVAPNLAFLDLLLDYDASNVYLMAKRNDAAFASIGQTPNQTATGGGVESLGPGNLIYDTVLNLSANQARFTFDQLSGEFHTSTRTALIEDSRFIRDAVNDRIRGAFDNTGGSGGTVVAYAGDHFQLADVNTERFTVWGRGFGSWGYTGSNGNAARFNRSTGGFFIGADTSVLGNWRVGTVAGYSQTSFNVKDRRSSGSVGNYHIGLYGGTQRGNIAFRTGAAYIWHDITASRDVVFPGFSSSPEKNYRAATAQIFGELGYGIDVRNARLEPFANLAHIHLHTEKFVEKGGVAALTNASSNTDTTFTTLGLRGSTDLNLRGTKITIRSMAGWRHAFGETAPLSTMRFSGGDAFAVGGVPVTRNAAAVEAGFDHSLSRNASLSLSYAGQFGSKLSDQSVRATFSMKF